MEYLEEDDPNQLNRSRSKLGMRKFRAKLNSCPSLKQEYLKKDATRKQIQRSKARLSLPNNPDLLTLNRKKEQERKRKYRAKLKAKFFE